MDYHESRYEPTPRQEVFLLRNQIAQQLKELDNLMMYDAPAHIIRRKRAQIAKASSRLHEARRGVNKR